MTKTVLILGSGGRFGRNAAQAFEAAGWAVRRFDRSRDDLARSARDADVIVNGWNPLYPDWAEQVPEQTRQVIHVARETGATVMIPGNVYVFGQQTPAPWSERSSHRAQNTLGRVRIEMEAAYAGSGVQTVILRAGDFIDTAASGNWFDMIMTKHLKKGVFTYPGNPDIPHAWAYLPDVARAAVQLAEIRDRLPVFSDIPFAGYTLTGREIAAKLSGVVGANIRLKRFSYLPVYAAVPFWRVARHLLEMRYLWTTPHWLDGSTFETLLPDFRRTPPEQALASAIPAELVTPQIHPRQPVAAGH